MSKKLAAKAGLIQLPPLTTDAPAASPVVGPDEGRAKTAPGSMLHFMTKQSAAVQEAEDLRERLREFEGAAPVRAIDPHLIRASKWANRHPDAFETAEFKALKLDIAAAGGNVQPIKVRPISALNGSTPESDGAQFEVVFGHRRHRACLELGIAVNAMVVPASDQELFVAMDRENRGRQNLSPWEQGSMYTRALESGLFPSMRKLADATGVDISLVSKSVLLARLPEAIIRAFASPLDIQFRWAQPLAEVVQKDPDGALARAKAMRTHEGQHSASDVFKAIVGAEPLNRSTASASRAIEVMGRRVAEIAEDAKGRVVVTFDRGILDSGKQADLIKSIQAMLMEQGSR